MATDPEALALLKKHEKEFDERVNSLSALTLPLRSVLSALFLVIDNRFHGARAGRVPLRQVEAGFAAVSRLSYIVKQLARCPLLPDGESAEDALSVIRDAEIHELKTLMLYAHFSELMPEVHRGYYEVTLDRDGVVLLRHPADFAAWEVRDTVMTEAASGFFDGPRTLSPGFFDERAAEAKLNLSAMVAGLKAIYDHYRQAAVEVPILSEKGFHAAVGCGPDEFDRFRAAWTALAEYCLGMAGAHARLLQAGANRGERSASELLEWIAVYLKKNFVDGTLIAIAQLSPGVYDGLLDVFGCRFPAIPRHAGDGFFPPIVRFPDAHLFNPDTVRSMLAARNIAYAVNRSDPAKFSKTVSADLEPSLIAAAMKAFEKIPGVEIVTNFEWKRGEIDVLLYRATENAAVHIQAKGALPAQGARMVQAVETRIIEGLDQLQRLREADPEERDSVVSAALKRDVHGVSIREALLCRAGMGTAKTWRRMGGVAPLNPPLLNAVAARYAREPSLKLTEFADVAAATLDGLVSVAFEGWEYAVLEFADLRVSIPLMRLDLKRLYRERASLFVA